MPSSKAAGVVVPAEWETGVSLGEEGGIQVARRGMSTKDSLAAEVSCPTQSYLKLQDIARDEHGPSGPNALGYASYFPRVWG